MPSTTSHVAPSADWLGFDCPFPQPVPRASVVGARPAVANVTKLLDPFGESVEREATELRVWRDAKALHIEARCATAATDRVRKLAERTTPIGRDEWGDDALELQIDVGRSREQYLHFILPPSGVATTYVGYNNRHVQGWHPRFDFRVELLDDAWVVTAALPFDALGTEPAEGDVWGLNVSRVNASEARGYVQWAPTFGDALRPELFGEMHFAGESSDRQRDIAAYAQRAAERKAYFLSVINAIREDDALRALGMADWQAWAQHMKSAERPRAVRWEGFMPGVDGIPQGEHKLILAEADAMVSRIATWSVDEPAQEAFGLASLEVLGDAWLLTQDGKYVRAFDDAVRVHAVLMKKILATVTDPNALHYSTNPYHDIQVVNTAIVSHAYFTLAQVGLAPETHAVMMWTVLRAGRFATYNIRTARCSGNHQVYESGGLGALAALYPEMPQSDQWAAVASRSIRMHLDDELYPDGGYMERCGYHSVALSFAMHAVTLVKLNHAEHRFAELMSDDLQQRLERMHDWLLYLNAPDGTFPAFGDCGNSTHLAFLQRGAAIYQRGDLAWPLRQLEPAMVPAGVEPTEPAVRSVSLESQFTVMRDGWTPNSFYMAVDHGPLGGQHSHPDTLGFFAHALGKQIAIDSGIGTSYEDKRYVTWFRKVRAHNTVVIDDIETEKVASLMSWHPGKAMDVLTVRGEGYRHALGVTHDRTIYFIKGVGWFIHDRLRADDADALRGRAVDWVMHTPFELRATGADLAEGRVDDVGLIVRNALPGSVAAPELTMKPSAVFVPAVRPMRLWDAGRRHGKEMTREVTELSWRHTAAADGCEFAVLLLPYRGDRPEVAVDRAAAAWRVTIGGARGRTHELAIPH